VSGVSSGFMWGESPRSENDDSFVRDLDPGHYVIRRHKGGPLDVGFRDDSSVPWTIVGSDEIFSDSEIHEVIRMIDMGA